MALWASDVGGGGGHRPTVQKETRAYFVVGGSTWTSTEPKIMAQYPNIESTRGMAMPPLLSMLAHWATIWAQWSRYTLTNTWTFQCSSYLGSLPYGTQRKPGWKDQARSILPDSGFVKGPRGLGLCFYTKDPKVSLFCMLGALGEVAPSSCAALLGNARKHGLLPANASRLRMAAHVYTL